MRIDRFEWDRTNRSHLARHKVMPEEAEEVFIGPLYLRRSRSGRYLAYGRTLGGRYLIVVFELFGTTVRVITARDMTESEKSLYRRRAKR
jgi:uncharacterized DUF497 family protein